MIGVGRVVSLVARHRLLLFLLVAPFVLCRPLAASFCCPEGEIDGPKEPGMKCRFWPRAVACELPSPASMKLVVVIGTGQRRAVGDSLLWIRSWDVGTLLHARSLLVLREGCARVIPCCGAICWSWCGSKVVWWW